ncbi:MAG: hypothetical protein QF615_00325 [Planctomycetota bacterium]|nr:hypothetical protein [Planctomycetota bacterium]MDP6368020.1 hypothetical protein [Planctomycetota bacterium]
MRGLTSLLCLCAPSLAQAPLISEFCASNRNVLDDEDGDSSDWFELHNQGTGLTYHGVLASAASRRSEIVPGRTRSPAPATAGTSAAPPSPQRPLQPLLMA